MHVKGTLKVCKKNYKDDRPKIPPNKTNVCFGGGQTRSQVSLSTNGQITESPNTSITPTLTLRSPTFRSVYHYADPIGMQ